MSDDIADFLRRAAQRRAQQKPQAPRRPPDIEIPDADVVDAEILEADEVSGDGIAGQVAQRMDTSAFSERASHLGQTVDRADDHMEAHLHEVFEHRLGQLGGKTALAEDSTLDDDQAEAQAPETPSPRVDLVDMLRDPQNLRSAIIAKEILTRPEHLW